MLFWFLGSPVKHFLRLTQKTVNDKTATMAGSLQGDHGGTRCKPLTGCCYIQDIPEPCGTPATKEKPTATGRGSEHIFIATNLGTYTISLQV